MLDRALLAFVVAVSFALPIPAQEADPPPPLTWDQLVARPELWPQQCRIVRGMKIGPFAFEKGQELPVVELEGEMVTVLVDDRQGGRVAHGDTDIVAVAEAAHAARTPAQRALDMTMLTQRADLWPAKIATRRTLEQVGFEADQVIERGAELSFGSFDGKWVRARHAKIDGLRALRLGETDLVERERAAIERADAAPKPHRVLAELDGKLVNAITGARKSINAKQPPEYLLLYASAGWCGPCQRFSPELVRFHQEHKAEFGKRFQTVWISRDRKESEMRQYAKSHDFPWLAVAWKKLGDVPITQAHSPLGIPDLVLLDQTGAVLATSYEGNDYKGPERVLAALTERLAGK